MDESQSSDFFSETEISYSNSMIMDSIPYETLITNTKLALSSESRKEIKKSTFSVYFTSLLEDCHNCMSQALDLIISILSDTDIQINKVVEYLNDAVSLLQMLSDFIKTVIESVSMTCQRMKTFPTATCDIILKIFMHCKDSEYLYGPYISNVEKQLKDLFRTCHELQLTYLMVIEKHFVFNLTENEDVDILSDTLDINLKIGDIAQTLDVKTMAEQWKAFTAICEKYSNVLLEKNIYNNSLGILSEMIQNNIKTALEKDQEEKIILRSLKVTSFSIKILLKICSIFKHATLKDHQKVFDLLLYIYSNNSAVLEIDSERSPQFLNIMNMNVFHPIELLLKQLFSDITFNNHLLNYDVCQLQSEDKILGYIIIVMSMIKSTMPQRDDHQRLPKHKLIYVIYNIFEHCHAHMNMGLKFPTESSSETRGLFENLLIHFVAFATTLNAEEFAVLERSMMDSILGSDCTAALFSANTWTLLARVISPYLLLNQLTSLCRLYQKLEKNKLFGHSPQKIHLSYTIRGLFEVMEKEDKIKIFKLFNIHEEMNHNLWCSLRIENLPEELKIEVKNVVMERLKIKLSNCFDADCGEIEKLVNIFDLASTCSIRNNNIVVCLIRAWNKVCPKVHSTTFRDFSKEILWYFNYVSSLVSFTIVNIDCLQSVHLMKILHVITEIVKIGNTELKLVFINIVCKFMTLGIHDDSKYTIESILIHLIKYLSQDTQDVVKYKLYSTLREYKGSPHLHRIIEVITKEDYSLKDEWDSFINNGILHKNYKWRELLLKDYKYRHKCIESNIESSTGTLKKSCSGNFELVDINSLFENESDSEPVHKKVKLNHNEADAIISRLENDVCSLCKLKQNAFTSEQKNQNQMYVRTAEKYM